MLAHLVCLFLAPAKKHGVGLTAYHWHIMIKALYKRAKNLADRIKERIAIPPNAAGMVACTHDLEKIWDSLSQSMAALCPA